MLFTKYERERYEGSFTPNSKNTSTHYYTYLRVFDKLTWKRNTEDIHMSKYPNI